MHFIRASRSRHAIAKSLRVRANDLDHHVFVWDADETAMEEGISPANLAPDDDPRATTPAELVAESHAERHGARLSGTVVLVHGFMDAAGTWEPIASHLAARGLRVIAPDMRGFGQGARVSSGGYYHFADYVFDLADVIDAASPGEPVSLVGHSMGGTIVTLFAGTFPERVSRLVNIEGLGPPDNAFDAAPVRMRNWITEVRSLRTRGVRRGTFTREEALMRLRMNHPNVPPATLEERLPHLVVDAPHAGEGRVEWRYDPLHRTTSPMPFFAEQFNAFARRVGCPVLFVSGGPTGFHPADEESRLSSFANLHRVEIASGGHMVHWTEPDLLAERLLTFLET